jgi:hypothetical protein
MPDQAAKTRAKKMWKRWTAEDEEFVVEHMGRLSDAQIGMLLGRTNHSIQFKRLQLAALRHKGRPKANENDVFAFIVDYKRKWRNSPSFKEIRDGCNLSSTSVVTSCLDRLADQGKIELGGFGQYRSILVVGARWIMEGED